MDNIHISFSPENVIEIAGIHLTNSVFTALIFITLAVVGLFIASYRISVLKPSGFQLTMEMLYEGLYGMAGNILGEEGIRKYFGFVFTFFVFILVSNLAGLLPIVPALVIHEEEKAEETSKYSSTVSDYEVSDKSKTTKEELEATCIFDGTCVITTDGLKENKHYIPVLRASTADLSAVITLAIISVVVTNIAGFMAIGFNYSKRYINFESPIGFVVGIFEIISELGKIISFAFRLFGNIFAGEVLLAVMTAITFGIATLPFLGFEFFVAFIQAFVFFILTTVFISLAREAHH